MPRPAGEKDPPRAFTAARPLTAAEPSLESSAPATSVAQAPATSVAQAPATSVAQAPATTIAPAEPAALGVKIFAPQPTYPDAARRAGAEGTVLTEAAVDGQGRVTGVRVLAGSFPELDRAAVEALERWRFEPARRGGQPVLYRYRQEFRFALSIVSEPPAGQDARRPPERRPLEPPERLVTPLPVQHRTSGRQASKATSWCAPGSTSAARSLTSRC